MSPTVTQPISAKAAKAIEWARERAEGWQQAYAFLAAHPEIADEVVTSDGTCVLAPITNLAEPLPFIEQAVASAVEGGVFVEPYKSDQYGGVLLCFGPVTIQIFTFHDRVYASQVVGQIDDVRYSPLFSIPSQDGEGEK